MALLRRANMEMSDCFLGSIRENADVRILWFTRGSTYLSLWKRSNNIIGQRFVLAARHSVTTVGATPQSFIRSFVLWLIIVFKKT